MKNSHWRSFKKGMSWFLTFAIAIGSQGTGLSAATLDYGQDYQVSVNSDVDTSQTQQIPASDGEGDTTQVEDISASGSNADTFNAGQIPASDSEGDTTQVEDISIPDSEEDPAQMEDISTSGSEGDISRVEDSSAQDSEGNASQIEDVFTDGDALLADNHEETADTTLLDAPADVKEGTIQYQIEEARKAGSTTLTIRYRSIPPMKRSTVLPDRPIVQSRPSLQQGQTMMRSTRKRAGT